MAAGSTSFLSCKSFPLLHTLRNSRKSAQATRLLNKPQDRANEA